MSAFVAIVVSALVLGSLYSLVAGGLSLMWSTLRVFNYAHGALLMFAAYLAWSLIAAWHIDIIAAFFITLIPMTAIAMLFEASLIRPFVDRKGGDLVVMISTLAAGTILENVAQLIWGPQLKKLPPVAANGLTIFGLGVEANRIAAIIAAPIALILVALFLKRSKLGTAIRATQQNRDFARLLGISPTFIYVSTIAIALALATLAGALYGGIFFVTPTMGDDPLLKAFVVMVFGGLASLNGTVAGAYVIGLVEAASTYYIGLEWTPVIVFGVMIVVLIARPEGLVSARKVTI